MMTLPEVYCRLNRARGMELLSPEDVLNACQSLEKINSPIEYAYVNAKLYPILQATPISVRSSCGTA